VEPLFRSLSPCTAQHRPFPLLRPTSTPPTGCPRDGSPHQALGRAGRLQHQPLLPSDKGFVAQTSDVASGRTAPMNDAQRREEERRVPLEVHQHIKHDKRGILSMARHSESMFTSFRFFTGASIAVIAIHAYLPKRPPPHPVRS
jgi:hypothetical protein